MKNKKNVVHIFLVVLLSSLLVLSLISCSNIKKKSHLKDNKHIILRLAESRSSLYPTSEGEREFAKLVENRTNGRIKIKIYFDEQLGDENSVIEQVQFGGIDFARVDLSSIADYSKKLNTLLLPFIFKDSEHMWKVLCGYVGEELLNNLIKEKFVGLCWYEGGTRGLYNNIVEIKNIEDLNGLKIRVPRSQILMDSITNIGASPVPMKKSEVYSALEKNFVDGVIDNIITYYYSKHYDIAKYFTEIDNSRIPEILIASKLTMNQLSKEDQAIIIQAALDSSKIQKKVWLERENEVKNELIQSGMKINKIDEESRQKFIQSSKTIYKQLTDKYGDIIHKITDEQ